MNEKTAQLEMNEVEESEIDLLDLAKYMLQHWVPIVILTAVGALIAFLVTAFMITRSMRRNPASMWCPPRPTLPLISAT
jgi:LPS O-antigen subunit length determinant protein (WzzB/FepE family)